MSRDCSEKHVQLHQKSMKATEAFTKAMMANLVDGVRKTIGGYVQFIENQSMELALLRELEEGVRSKSLSSGDMKEILDLLDALRKEIAENAAKASAAAKEKTEAVKS